MRPRWAARALAVAPCLLLLLLGVEASDGEVRLHEERLPILVDRKPDPHAGVDFNASLEEFPGDSAVVPCAFLPTAFIWCEPPAALVDALASASDAGDAPQEEKPAGQPQRQARAEPGFGCARWGGRRYEDVARTRVQCHALRGIECRGNRTFLRGDVPCLRFSGHHFLTTLLYSLLLGFLGIDRFCLGHTGSAVGKLLTLGGVGVWWVVDIVLLIFGDLGPSDDSSWMPFY